MPYIDLKTTAAITKDAEEKLRRAFGEKIALLPGKSEQWLMLNFSDNCRMAFRGTAEPAIAMLEVKIFGSASPADYDRLTAALTETVESVLGVPKDRVYIKYDEVEHWGYAGENF